MDYTLPIAKRTRSGHDRFYRECFRKIKEERETENINVGESVSDNANEPRRGKEKKQVEKGKEGNGSDSDMDCESIACSNSAKDFSCVAKRTRSQFNVTSEKKASVEHGSASRPFCIDEDELGSSSQSDDSSDNDSDNETIQNDDSSDDSFVDETNHRVHDDSNEVDGDETNLSVQKNLHHRRNDEDYPDVWTNGFDRSLKKKSKGLEDDKLELRKPTKKKRISVKKKYDVSKILLDSIFESGVGLEELVSKRNFSPRAEINPQGDVVTLPLKFTFVDEQPNSPEISEFDRELNALWADLEFALRSSEIGSSHQVYTAKSY